MTLNIQIPHKTLNLIYLKEIFIGKHQLQSDYRDINWSQIYQDIYFTLLTECNKKYGIKKTR